MCYAVTYVILTSGLSYSQQLLVVTWLIDNPRRACAARVTNLVVNRDNTVACPGLRGPGGEGGGD